MTNIAKELRSYLLTKTPVTDLVASRVYYGHLPQRATVPAIVLSVVNSIGERNLVSTSGKARSRMQLDCYGATYTAATNLGEAVRTSLDTFSGTMGAIEVDETIVESYDDTEDPPIDGSDLFRYVRSLDVILWHDETVPSV